MKVLFFILLPLSLFSANYLVQIDENELQTIQACITGTPDNKMVQMCINHKMFNMRYNGSLWELEKVPARNENNNCSCLRKQNAKVIAKSKTIIRQRVSFREVWVEEIPNAIIINKPSDLTKIDRNDKLNTDIICVKCGE